MGVAAWLIKNYRKSKNLEVPNISPAFKPKNSFIIAFWLSNRRKQPLFSGGKLQHSEKMYNLLQIVVKHQ
jgi:hypothetical protein